MYNEYDYICHYGIKGMKWGIRRTPEQLGHVVNKAKKKIKSAVESSPIGRKKRSKGSSGQTKKSSDMTPEDKEAKKKQVLESRSAKQLYDNANLFTTQELQSAYNRLALERNIKNLAPKEVSKGQKYLDKYVKTANNVSAFLKSTNAVLGQANAFMKIMNNLSGGNKSKSSGQSNSSNKNSSSNQKKQTTSDSTSKKKSNDNKTTTETSKNNTSKREKKSTASAVEDVIRDVANTRRKGESVDFDRGMDYVADIIDSLPEGTTVRGLLGDGSDRKRRR